MNWAAAIYMWVNLFNVLTSSSSASCFVSLIVHFSPFQVVACVYWWFWGYKNFGGPCSNLNAAKQVGVYIPLTNLVQPDTPWSPESESPVETGDAEI